MFSFPKRARLRKRESFIELQKKGLLFCGKYLLIQWKKTENPIPRLGITVTKKYGSSVKRNRAKRLIREAFRLQASSCSHVDFNVKPKHAVQEASLEDIQRDLRLFISTANG